jgi:hypothetical protein
LNDPATIVPRPGFDKEGNPQSAIKLPVNVELPNSKVKVSNSDLELLIFEVKGPDCFCEWRLAIDWTSGGRSGTTLVDHGFGKIRSATKRDTSLPAYGPEDGEWKEKK